MLKVLIGAVLIFGLFGIIGAISADITGEVQSDYLTGAAGCNATSTELCGHAYNISEYSLESQAELSGWTPTIALAVAAGIVITAVLGFLAVRSM